LFIGSNNRIMKNLKLLSIFLLSGLILFACSKKDNDHSERFRLLTGTVWHTDTLLVDGEDASGPGQILEKFKGDAEFYEDGTGYFGQYIGCWYFTNSETNITITSDPLILPLSSNIIELTAQSLKLTTNFPTAIPEVVLDIRITFKAK